MALVLVLLSFLAACTTPAGLREPTPSSLPTPTVVPSPPVELVLLLPELPETFNPLYPTSWSTRALQDLFLVGLWSLDDRLAPVAELAADIPSRSNGGLSADGRKLTVRLRSDATWSDGQPITADDVLFTYQMLVAEGNAVLARFPYDAFVETVLAVDTHTVEVHFSRPFAPWPAYLFPYVLPRHVLEPIFSRDGSLDNAGWNQRPAVGSGPFIYRSRVGSALLFEANPHYWRGQPPVDRITVRQVADPVVRWFEVTIGSADFAPLLWPEMNRMLVPPEGVSLLSSSSGHVETLFLNLDPRTGHPALQSREVRAALAQAVDRETVCSSLAAGVAAPADSLWSGTVYEEPAGEGSATDSAQAAARLEAAGWSDLDGGGVREQEGRPLSLRYAVPPAVLERSAAQAQLSGMLAAVGIETIAVAVAEPWGDGSLWDLAQWAAPPPGYPDPDDPRWLCAEARPGGANVAGVCDEELDRLLMAQAGTLDFDRRAALLFQIQGLRRQEVWWLPLCRWQDRWAVDDRLVGPRPWRGAPFWNVGQWRLDRGG